MILTTTSTVTMGQQEYPSGARETVGEMIGNQVKIRRSAKPGKKRMSKNVLKIDHLLVPWQAAKM